MKKIYLISISAILMSISQQPWGFGSLAWFSLVPLIFFLNQEKKLKNIIIYTFLWSFIYHFIFFHWLSENIGLDSQLDRYITLIIVVLVLSVNILLIYISYYYLKKYLRHTNCVYILPFLITSIEYLRSIGFYGSAWNSLSYSQTDYSLISQNVEYTGIFGLTFWIVLVNVIIYQLINNFNKKNILLLLLVFFFPWVTGSIIKNSYNNELSELKIKVVQPDISLDQKNNIMDSLNDLIALSNQTSNDSISLIIWPETSISGNFINNAKYNRNLSKGMNDFLQSNNFSLMAGLILRDFNNNKRYNSAVLFQGDSISGIYNKQRLVPHVEHTPEIFNKLGLHLIKMGNYNIGEDLSLFNINGINFTSMICIESVFPNPTRHFINSGAEFIIYIVNDAWYPGNPQLEQHARRSIYRSIEHRKTVVRCANTGISMIVDPYGNITDKLEFNKPGVIETDILISDKKTFYTKYGDLFSKINVIVLILFILSAIFRRVINRKNAL